MRSTITLAALLLSLPSIVVAQNQELKFEVASIREHVGGVSVMDVFKSSGPRAEYQGFSIAMLISEAWKVRGNEIALSPGVSRQTVYGMMDAGRNTGVYEIMAEAPEGMTPTRDQFRIMLQSLLANRFKLVTHTEQREAEVYVLEKNGTPRLRASASDQECHANISPTPAGQKVVAVHCPIETLIGDIFVGRPVYDETGLTGFYDFEFTAAVSYQSTNPEAITPFTAVKDLGLKLEAQRRTVDTIVIDHVEEPSEN